MPAPADRLEELRRQRALVAGHLAWLDTEIARAEHGDDAPATEVTAVPFSMRAPDAPSPAPKIPSATVAAPRAENFPGSAAPLDIEALLAEQRQDPAAARDDIRKGCLLYFAAALLLLSAVVGALYFFFQRGH